MPRKIPLLFGLLGLVGCGEGGVGERLTPDLPTGEFAEQYLLADFNLDDQYDYWEIRQGRSWESPPDNYSISARYDEAAYAELDTTQTDLLADTVAQSGFAYGCAPSSCNIYAVAVRGYAAISIDSQVDLLQFLGEIDTEAELAIWLDYAYDYAPSTEPVAFEETPQGYLAVLDWDSLCGSRGSDLVLVYRNGTIEKIVEIERQSYNACA